MQVHASPAPIYMFEQATQVFVDREFPELSGHFKDTAFYKCTFNKMTGLTLENCSLSHSTVKATDPRDILGVTVTLDCKTFDNLELSEEVFDFLLLLLCKTRGNEEKRTALLSLIGTDKAKALLRLFNTTE